MRITRHNRRLELTTETQRHRASVSLCLCGYDSRYFRAILAVLLLVGSWLLLRRSLLVLLLAAKILGYSGPLNAWQGTVSRQTIMHAGVPIDVYRGRNPVSPLLIVHGVNPTGKDNVDLIRVSEGLAQAGYEVYVPDLVEMKRQHLR